MQQYPSAGPAAVLGPKRAQVRGVREPWPPARLDLDRQELAARLDHEIDLLADGRAPVAELRALDARVPPAEEVVQDEVLQVRAGRLVRLAQVQRDSRISPVDLGRLDQALGAVHGVCREAPEQVGRLEQVQ